MSLARLLLITGLLGGGGGGGGGGGAKDAVGATTVRQIRMTRWAFLTLFSKFRVTLARSSLAVSLTRFPSTVFVTRRPNFLALSFKSLYCI